MRVELPGGFGGIGITVHQRRSRLNDTSGISPFTNMSDVHEELTSTGGPHSPHNHSDSAMLRKRKELRRWERIIEQHQHGWHVVATAHLEIEEHRLYEAAGLSESRRYWRERWHKGKSTVDRMFAIAEVYRALASAGAGKLPKTERQMRPLLRLRHPKEPTEVWGKKVAEVWAKAVQESEITKRRLTGTSVARAMQQLGLGQATEKTPELDLEKRWERMKAQLQHEPEFWPVDRRRELHALIVGVIDDWPEVKDHLSDTDVPTTSVGHQIEDHGCQAEPQGTANQSEKTIRPDNACRFAFWDDINWRLKNSDLAEIWGLKPNTVKMMRFRRELGRAAARSSEAYQNELEEEKVKAKALIQSNSFILIEKPT